MVLPKKYARKSLRIETLKSVNFFLFSALIVWIPVNLLLYFWNVENQKHGTIETAKIEARTLIKKDILYRMWNANHGGVYVPVTEKTKPNKYLKKKGRDIVTKNGLKFTKINPAYMTRQVYEIASKDGVTGHLTSLKPIRPENRPDQWEEKALHLFTQGKKEVSTLVKDGEKHRFRLMMPLYTKTECLQCHAMWGFRKGDLRGGLSISIPFAPHMKLREEHINSLRIAHTILLLLGTLGIVMVFLILRHKIKSQDIYEEKIRNQEKLQGVIEMAGAVCHELNQPMQGAMSASELIQIKMKEKNPVDDEVAHLIEALEKMGIITEKLMKITKYETKKYLKSDIIDIDKASEKSFEKEES